MYRVCWVGSGDWAHVQGFGSEEEAYDFAAALESKGVEVLGVLEVR